MERESLKATVKHSFVNRILNQTVLGHIESYYTIFSKVTAEFTTRNKKIYSSAGISRIKSSVGNIAAGDKWDVLYSDNRIRVVMVE